MRLIDAEDVKKRADCYPPQIRNVVANILRHTKTVKPEQKKGKWIITHDGGLNTAVCSECKYMIGHIVGCEYFRYCPNCGARLEVGDE